MWLKLVLVDQVEFTGGPLFGGVLFWLKRIKNRLGSWTRFVCMVGLEHHCNSIDVFPLFLSFLCTFQWVVFLWVLGGVLGGAEGGRGGAW